LWGERKKEAKKESSKERKKERKKFIPSESTVIFFSDRM
jgi:hypothetical protein